MVATLKFFPFLCFPFFFCLPFFLSNSRSHEIFVTSILIHFHFAGFLFFSVFLSVLFYAILISVHKGPDKSQAVPSLMVTLINNIRTHFSCTISSHLITILCFRIKWHCLGVILQTVANNQPIENFLNSNTHKSITQQFWSIVVIAVCPLQTFAINISIISYLCIVWPISDTPSNKIFPYYQFGE